MNIDMIKDKFKIIISKIKKLDKDYIIIGIIIISVITFMVLNIGKVKEFEEKETTGNIEKNITVSEESKDNKEKEGNEEDKKENISSEIGIFVHVDGYVNNPGVYQLKENERTNVLIEKAGGLKNGYSIKNINLAAKLSDGDKVYIPSVEEEKTLGNQNNNNVNTGGKHINNGNNSNNNVANIYLLLFSSPVLAKVFTLFFFLLRQFFISNFLIGIIIMYKFKLFHYVDIIQ